MSESRSEMPVPLRVLEPLISNLAVTVDAAVGEVSDTRSVEETRLPAWTDALVSEAESQVDSYGGDGQVRRDPIYRDRNAIHRLLDVTRRATGRLRPYAIPLVEATLRTFSSIAKAASELAERLLKGALSGLRAGLRLLSRHLWHLTSTVRQLRTACRIERVLALALVGIAAAVFYGVPFWPAQNPADYAAAALFAAATALIVLFGC